MKAPDDSAEPVLNVVKNLAEVDRWIEETTPVIPTLKTHSDFMDKVVECMNMASYLLRLGVSVAPDEPRARRGYTKPRAIIVGHLVRLMKLYEALHENLAGNRGEFCAIFGRLIIETAVRLDYLMSARRSSFGHFVLISYRPEKDQLEDLQSKAKSRPLSPIERRMLTRIKSCLRRDGISLKRLMEQKTWRLDGKSFRKILEDLGAEWTYFYGFGAQSHFVHGDWRDIDHFHLRRKGRFYKPNWQYSDSDPRYGCPLTRICLELLNRYLAWSKTDPDNFIRPVVSRLNTCNRLLDEEHERRISSIQRSGIPGTQCGFLDSDF